MAHKVKFWAPGSLSLQEIEAETLPACPGKFNTGDPGCPRRPDYVLTWTTSGPLGLPKTGTRHVHYACRLHVHRLMKHALSQGQHVTVTAYEGK